MLRGAVSPVVCLLFPVIILCSDYRARFYFYCIVLCLLLNAPLIAFFVSKTCFPEPVLGRRVRAKQTAGSFSSCLVGPTPCSGAWLPHLMVAAQCGPVAARPSDDGVPAGRQCLCGAAPTPSLWLQQSPVLQLLWARRGHRGLVPPADKSCPLRRPMN